MDIADLNSLRAQVLWAAFAVAVAFGAIAQRTQFCTMGAVSDMVNMGNWARMRMWGLAVGVATIGFYLMGWLGWIDTANTMYASSQVIWLSALVGGALFGFGMVLASGCGSKTLVRVGSGSLKSLVVFFVMGFSAYATLSGVLAVVRVNTLDRVAFSMPSGGTLPLWLTSVVGGQAATVGLVAALVVGGSLVVWAWPIGSSAPPTTCWVGIGLGLTVVAMWWVSGYLAFVPEHPLDAGADLSGDRHRAARVTDVHRAHGLHLGLVDFVQRCIQPAHAGGRIGGRCGGWFMAAKPVWAQLPVGRFSRYPRHGVAPGRCFLYGCRWRHRVGLHRGPRPVWAVNIERGQLDCRDRYCLGCAVGVFGSKCG